MPKAAKLKQKISAVNIGIEEKDRAKIAQGLSHLLADTYTLYLRTHYFHWNVTGAQFRTLHLMFEEQYNELWMAVDAIAERIRTLGYPAPGTYREFAALTSIADIEGVRCGRQPRGLRPASPPCLLPPARALLAPATKGEDESTADLVTQRLQIHEKTAWMLRSLLA